VSQVQQLATVMSGSGLGDPKEVERHVVGESAETQVAIQHESRGEVDGDGRRKVRVGVFVVRLKHPAQLVGVHPGAIEGYPKAFDSHGRGVDRLTNALEDIPADRDRAFHRHEDKLPMMDDELHAGQHFAGARRRGAMWLLENQFCGRAIVHGGSDVVQGEDTWTSPAPARADSNGHIWELRARATVAASFLFRKIMSIDRSYDEQEPPYKHDNGFDSQGRTRHAAIMHKHFVGSNGKKHRWWPSSSRMRTVARARGKAGRRSASGAGRVREV
jgi:hypothetical protein